MDKKVLIAAPVHPVLTEALEALGYSCEHYVDIQQDQAYAIIDRYEGIITSTRLQLDENLLKEALRLRWIGRMGSGMEVIDTIYTHSRGIYCCSSPEGNANAVAEQALGMLLAVQHKVMAAHAEMQQGLWRREENRGWEIEGSTAGIIGFGHNGSAFAKKLIGMDVQVLAYDKYQQRFGTPQVQALESLQELFSRANILSFHVPLTPETHHYFDEQFLDSMTQEFVLLNLSRGPVVSMRALYKGIKSGKITAAALDVWEQEPVQRMSGEDAVILKEMLQMPNFIGTPHIGGYTHQALYKMSAALAAKIKAFVNQR